MSAGASLLGKTSKQKKGGLGIKPPVYPLAVCTYVHAGAQVQIELGSRSIGLSSGSGGAGSPGNVAKNEPTLGSGASYVYNVNPKFAFTQVTFIKGAYWVQIFANNGKVAPSRVLGLSHVVYANLP